MLGHPTADALPNLHLAVAPEPSERLHPDHWLAAIS
jgi:hypothetical protein